MMSDKNNNKDFLNILMHQVLFYISFYKIGN